MKYGKFLVNGCHILLFGTDHTPVENDAYDPTTHPAYMKLRRFNPSMLFVELEHGEQLSSAAGMQDARALQAYIDSYNPKVIKYDRQPELSLTSYAASWSQEEREDFKQHEDANLDEKRELINSGSPKMFIDVYADREDHASSVFLEKFQPGRKVAVHCGRDHFPAYERLFEFLP